MCWFMLIQKSCAFYWMDHNKDGKKDMSLSIIIFCPDPPPTLNISISYPTELAAFPQPVSMHIPLLLNPRWLKPRLSKSPSEALAGLSSNDELHTCNVSWSKCQSVSTEPKAAGWGSACLHSYWRKGTSTRRRTISERGDCNELMSWNVCCSYSSYCYIPIRRSFHSGTGVNQQQQHHERIVTAVNRGCETVFLGSSQQPCKF